LIREQIDVYYYIFTATKVAFKNESFKNNYLYVILIKVIEQKTICICKLHYSLVFEVTNLVVKVMILGFVVLIVERDVILVDFLVSVWAI